VTRKNLRRIQFAELQLFTREGVLDDPVFLKHLRVGRDRQVTEFLVELRRADIALFQFQIIE
jgi:hypothetical protein